MPKRIYVASSWRNPYQPQAVERFRAAGHFVYDFRNPPSGSLGFDWAEIDPAWKTWTPQQFIDALGHEIAEEGFKDDVDGMEWADVFVLLLPCGRSAHLEAGWAIGRDIPTYVVVGDRLEEAELMYKLANRVESSIDDVIDLLALQEPPKRKEP